MGSHMIRGRIDGMLVDPENIAQIGDAVRWILQNETARAAMGRAARAEAERRFHPDRIAEKTVAMYRTVLEIRSQ